MPARGSVKSLSVFISGTFMDMEQWRSCARDRLSALTHEPVDLSQRPEESVQTMQFVDEALEQVDAFLGLYGIRYGSRVNNNPDLPSWTHYEYNRVMDLINARNSPHLMLAHPRIPSEAHSQIEEATRAAVKRLSRADRRAQSDFIRHVRGEPPLSDSIFGGSAGSKEARHFVSRRTRLFGSRHELEKEIGDFVQLVVQKNLEARIATLENSPSAPSSPSWIGLLARRLAVGPLPPALCVVVPRLPGRVSSAELAGALADANPWEVEDLEEHIDFRGERFGDAEPHLEAFRAVAAKMVGADVRPGDLVERVVERLVLDEAPRRMFRIDGLKGNQMDLFIEEIWAPLETAMRRIRARHGEAAPSLLMIISCEQTLKGGLRRLCHPVSDGRCRDYRKPVVVTPEFVADHQEPERVAEAAI